MPIYTIDNWYGDQRPGSSGATPTYIPAEPEGQWDPPLGSCPACQAGDTLPGQDDVDVTQVHSGTWQSVTVSPGEPITTVSVTFNGTWVAVYCLLPANLGPYITTYTNVSFMLDDQLVGTYERPTSTAPSWTYNFSMFHSEQLENGEHTLVVQPRGDVNTSFFVLDYFAYDYNGDPAPSSASTNTVTTTSSGVSSPSSAPITSTSSTSSTSLPQLSSTAHTGNTSHTPLAASIGGAFGGLSLALLILAIWFTRRKRNRNSQRATDRSPELNTGRHISQYNPPSPYVSTGSARSIREGSTAPFLHCYQGTAASKSERPMTVPRGPEALRNANTRNVQLVPEHLEPRQLSTPFDPEQGSGMEVLRREVEAMRLQIERLHHNAVFVDDEGAPPSYISEWPNSPPETTSAALDRIGPPGGR